MGMNLYQFIASLVNSLAWPVAVVVVAIVLRRPLALLLPRLQSLKYKDWHVEFSKQLDRVEEKLEAEVPKPPLARPTTKAVTPEALPPSAQIVVSWSVVERELRRIASDKLGTSQVGYVSGIRKVITLLERGGIIDANTAFLARELEELRNSAAHVNDNGLSELDADRFARFADNLLARLPKN